ncbi:MAG: hypothetical protein HY438_02580 [DPANN group archaeon]|nr:hypothetical protein [DPANN group archaeon]
MQSKHIVEKVNGQVFLRMQPLEEQPQNHVVAIIQNVSKQVLVSYLAVYDYSGQLPHGTTVGLQDGLCGAIYEEDGSKKIIVQKDVAHGRVLEGAVADSLEKFSKSVEKEMWYVFSRHATPSAALDDIFSN